MAADSSQCDHPVVQVGYERSCSRSRDAKQQRERDTQNDIGCYKIDTQIENSPGITECLKNRAVIGHPYQNNQIKNLEWYHRVPVVGPLRLSNQCDQIGSPDDHCDGQGYDQKAYFLNPFIPEFQEFLFFRLQMVSDISADQHGTYSKRDHPYDGYFLSSDGVLCIGG